MNLRITGIASIKLAFLCSVANTFQHFHKKDNFDNYIFVSECAQDHGLDLQVQLYFSWPKMIVRCPQYEVFNS